MRQKLALLLASLAAGVLVARLLRWRRQSQRPELPAQTPDARADALRRQLAESRGDPDTSPALTGNSASDVDEARRKVHEHGRAAVEEMRRAGG